MKKIDFWSFVSNEMLIIHFFCQTQQFFFCQVNTESLTQTTGKRNAVCTLRKICKFSSEIEIVHLLVSLPSQTRYPGNLPQGALAARIGVNRWRSSVSRRKVRGAPTKKSNSADTLVFALELEGGVLAQKSHTWSFLSS